MATKESKNKVTIDLDVWCTSAEKAKELGLTRQAVHAMVKRGQIMFWKIPELNNLVLVLKGKNKKQTVSE